jgi:DNA invertase Pin-like site-specific DNA recombinase
LTSAPALLAKACRVHHATLVIAKLDRLSRDANFLLGLQKAGVEFVCVDDPHMTPLTLGVCAVVAQHEREMISQRTEAALAVAQKNGKKLGGRRYKLQRDAEGEIVTDAKGKPARTEKIANGSDRARCGGCAGTRRSAGR